MALSKQKFREMVFQLLFCSEFAEKDEEMLDFMMQQLKVTRKSVESALAQVDMLWQKKAFLDELIEKTATSYSISRIPKVELSILRLGAFEILFDKSVPAKVALAEAMRLARKFATKESGGFINAILDGIYKLHEQAVPQN